mmetsp:Transcript_28370/g.56685  ORF Transcript_28370/g.56685 Transcript_28370/m.56685 type:complete len:276 (+) Transcript_28370:138-965(+)
MVAKSTNLLFLISTAVGLLSFSPCSSFVLPTSPTSLSFPRASHQLARRRPRGPYSDSSDDDDDDYDDDYDSRRPFAPSNPLVSLRKDLSTAFLAGIFALGVGAGVTVDSAINTNEKDLASRDAIDKNAPNPRLCTTYGASAMAFDQRVFVSFNPFNVYVSQADVKPACVLRQSTAPEVLRTRKLLNDREVRECKSNIRNTWAFVGDLGDRPQLSCVYQSEDAQNEFLSNPKLGIGEDVYDDDRMREAVDTKKKVKAGESEGQKEKRRRKEEAAVL